MHVYKMKRSNSRMIKSRSVHYTEPGDISKVENLRNVSQDENQKQRQSVRASVYQKAFSEKDLFNLLKVASSDSLQTSKSKISSIESVTSTPKSHEKSDELPLLSQKDLKIDFRRELTKPGIKNGISEDTNMYLDFLRMSPNMAAIWRPKVQRTLDGMSLSEKCEAITTAIANDFVEWMKSLGSENNSDIDVESILNMFEIGFNSQAADSLCVNIEEMLSVTKSLANARHVEGASHSEHLYKQLHRDINAVKKKEDFFAFGTMLPPEMRQVPQRDNAALNWLQNKRVPKEIADMSIIWDGIENYHSTQGFCKWLKRHPHIKPPEYLVKQGLLRESNARIVPSMSEAKIRTSIS